DPLADGVSVMKVRRVTIAVFAAALTHAPATAQTPNRSDTSERATLMSLIAAVDAAQSRDSGGSDFTWESHALQSVDGTAFVPFRVFPPETLRTSKNALMYVRAVSRHDGVPSKDERSFLRDALLRNALSPRGRQETVYIAAGEMPVGGPASTSSR